MAEKAGDSGSGNASDAGDASASDVASEVSFVTPDKNSDHENEDGPNIGQILYGQALDFLGDEADIDQAYKVDGELDGGLILDEEERERKPTQARRAHGAEESKIAGNFQELKDGDQEVPMSLDDSIGKASEDVLSEEVETNVEVMYQVHGKDSNHDQSVRVLKFSTLFLPDTDKRRREMEMFNRRYMMDVPELENEITRQRKRDYHKRHKKAQIKNQRKAKYLPVNPFLEDFYYLQGFNKSGVAPQSSKRLQAPPGYKSLFASQKLDSNAQQVIDKILPARAHRRGMAGAQKVSFNQSLNQPHDTAQSQMPDNEAFLKESDRKRFALESCQINELKSSIAIATKIDEDSTEARQNGVQDELEELDELRAKLKKAKVQISATLDQKMPKPRTNKVEQQSFALITKLNQLYSDNNAAIAQNRNQSGPFFAKKRGRNQLPSEVEIYEEQIKEKFKHVGVPSKRVKYWGELRDVVSESQKLKDSHMIRKQEWMRYMRNKADYKQPVFSFVTPASGLKGAEAGAAPGLNKDDPKAGVPGAAANNGALYDHLGQKKGPPGALSSADALKARNMPGKPPMGGLPGGPVDPNKKSPLQPGAPGAGSRQLRRPPPLLVDKSDFDLVTSFEEYEKLKKQEQLYYKQRKKTNVTAESIMRHVRWKMGKISDQEFYREEYLEIRREEQLEEKAAKVASVSLASSTGGRAATMRRAAIAAAGASTNEMTSAEPKDLESSRKARTVPIDFEENLDIHFDRKRVEIQERILRRKSEKERMSQQKQNTTQTPAYEPIVSVEAKESEEDHRESENKENPSDDDSSSSDSDSDLDDADNQNQLQSGPQMPPQIAEELNHAQCISDLSYFKLNWGERDLQTFHRPNVQSCFDEMPAANAKVPMQAVSKKKEDKETRLDAHLYFKTRLKLSLNKGKFCVFEHIDQHPLFLNNFGMASRLRRYYYGSSHQIPSKKEFTKGQNQEIRHIGPHGKLVVKKMLEKLDLLGQVDKEKYKGITLLENNMYNAPVYYHRNSSTNNDFFCSIVKQGGNNERRIVIRSLNSFYTVGQIEPKREVYNPQSRHFTHFIKTQSKAYTTRLLQENEIMSFHDIRQFFPQIGSPILKKGLKEIEVEQDRSGYCHLNANFESERHKDRMTPEMICQYESARHGQYRLERLGVTEILSADKISYSTHKFCFEETDLLLQRVAKLIESEVLQTPWNLSSNYIKIKHEGSMMMLQGQGDPSYGHGGYSFLKMPLKISADSIQGAKLNRMNLNPAIQNPKAVTGTEADLRKLKKRQLYDILFNAGVPQEDLETKTRWEMVAQLRCFASQSPSAAFTQNSSTMKSFYARGVRNTSKQQQLKYNKRANSTFRKQMDNLSVPNPKDLHDESEEEPDFTCLPDLDAMGLIHVSNGFGTSLTRPKKSTVNMAALVPLREPGENAKDFTRDIYQLVYDESRKQIVEIASMPRIDTIEDIKDYLKLFLVIHPNALSPQNQNPSGINIGGVSSNAEFLYAMNGNGSREWERKLLEKLQQREITKKCEILCHKIRSLTWEETKAAQLAENGGEAVEDPEGIKQEQGKEYERVIFCADEKAIKKFRRCMNKNQQRTPKRTTRRQLARTTRPLNAENLKRQEARSRMGRAQNKSGSRSATSNSVVRQGSAMKANTYKGSQKEDGSIYSQPTRDQGKVKLGGYTSSLVGQKTQQRNMNSGQKPKSKKRKQAPLVAAPQPALRFNITNNGVVPPQSPMEPAPIQAAPTHVPLSLPQSTELSMAAASVTAEQPKPIQIVALAGNEPPKTEQMLDLFNDGMVAVKIEPGLHSQQPTVQSEMDVEPEGAYVERMQEPQVNDDDNNLVNHDEVSNVASEYEPDNIMGDESEEYDDFGVPRRVPGNLKLAQRGKASPLKKKKPTGKQPAQGRSSLSLIRTQSNGKLGGRSRKTQSSTSKFKPHGFSNDDFEYQTLTANKSRRRQQQDGTQSLNTIFMEIIEKMMQSEKSYLFHNQPTRQDAPNYRDLIKQPIALKDMKNKSKRNEYKDRLTFESDIALMVDNAVQFNGELHYIAQLARDIQTIAIDELESKRGDIETMECVIRMDGAGF